MENPCSRQREKIAFLIAAAFSRDGACIAWPYGRNNQRGGYGKWRPQMAHRAALIIKLGRPLQKGEQAQHTCDNPPCCNGSHLIVGSHADNIRDAFARGLMTCKLPFGEMHHSAKLNESCVRFIREANTAGLNYLFLADMFKVSSVAIGKVCRRATWKKVV